MADQIQFRRDTAANWTTTNPILAAGEFGWETNTRKGKVGDGTTAWTALDYSFVSDAPTGGGADVRKYLDAYYHNGYSSNQLEPTIAEDETVYVPLVATVFMKGGHTLTALRMNQVAGGSGVELRFGLYSAEDDGTLLRISDLGFVTLTGLTAFELTTSVNMPQGKLYYIAIKFNNNSGTTTQVTGIQGNPLGPFGIASSDLTTVHQGLRKASTAGTMPATDTLPTASVSTSNKGNVHLIYKMQPTV